MKYEEKNPPKLTIVQAVNLPPILRDDPDTLTDAGYRPLAQDDIPQYTRLQSYISPYYRALHVLLSPSHFQNSLPKHEKHAIIGHLKTQPYHVTQFTSHYVSSHFP